LDLSTAETYLRGVTDVAPRITVLFSGFQRLIHIFEGDHTPAADILCTILKGYDASLYPSDSLYGSGEIVKLLFHHIFSRLLHSEEGNLCRIFCLATPEGRSLYRTKFMMDRNEFRDEPACPYQLGLAVDIEDKTRTAISFVNEHAQKIVDKFNEVQKQPDEIRNALANRKSSEFESDASMIDNDEDLSDSESPQDGDRDLDDDWGSLPESQGSSVASEYASSPGSPCASTCEFCILTENLRRVEHALSSLC
jgi:hypothetical protein